MRKVQIVITLTSLLIGALSIKESPYFIKLNYEEDLARGSKVLGADRHEPPCPEGRNQRKGLQAALGQHSVQRMGSCQDPHALARRMTLREGGLLKPHSQLVQARLGTLEA